MKLKLGLLLLGAFLFGNAAMATTLPMGVMLCDAYRLSPHNTYQGCDTGGESGVSFSDYFTANKPDGSTGVTDVIYDNSQSEFLIYYD